MVDFGQFLGLFEELLVVKKIVGPRRQSKSLGQVTKLFFLVVYSIDVQFYFLSCFYCVKAILLGQSCIPLTQMNSQIEMNKAKHFQRIGLSTHCLHVSYMKMQHELQNKITKGKNYTRYD